MILNVEHLTGGYTLQPILHDVHFNVKAGECVALIGLNGAGKSTTIKHIIGLLQAFSGNITINHVDINQNINAYRQQLAYIPETPLLYPELTLKEHIECVALAHQLTAEEGLKQAEPYLNRFRLADKLDWYPAYFSKGMKQKVMLICAFMLDVPLYIIDEPFLGLDPIAIRQLLQIIDEKKAKGAGILMSTHVLSTAEKQCDRFIFLHEGRIKADGSLQALQIISKQPDASLDDIYLHVVDTVVSI